MIREARAPARTDIQKSLAGASDRIQAWVDRQLDDNALDIARLYRASRDTLVNRLRGIYESYLGDDPTFLRARTTAAGGYLNQAIDDVVDKMTDRLGRQAIDHTASMLNQQSSVLDRSLSRYIGTDLAELPMSTQTVLGELTTSVVGGGTFYDRLFHVNDGLKQNLVTNVRQGLLNGETFDQVRDRVQKAFGVDNLEEPNGPAYGSVKVYKNEARRQWNLLMSDVGDETEGTIQVWWATMDERSTPGCVARHGYPIEEDDEPPPRHINCRCIVAIFPEDHDFTADREEAEVWLAAKGYSRRRALLKEAFDPGKHPRDPEGQFASSGATFSKAGDTVDGRKVRDEIPNRGSIASSLTNYKVLPGVREVPFSAFKDMPDLKQHSKSERERVQKLADQIKDSKEINPLIVVDDGDPKGPYILEGGHRFDALRTLGAKSFPALVVHDLDELKKRAKEAGFDSSKHPRDEGGQFASTGGAFSPEKAQAGVKALPTHPSKILADVGWKSNPLNVVGEIVDDKGKRAWTEFYAPIQAKLDAMGDFGRVLDKGVPEEHNIDSLASYQTWLRGDTMADKSGNLDLSKPLGAIAKYKGQDFIVDGNHRIAAAKLGGATKVKVVRIKLPEGESEALVPGWAWGKTTITPATLANFEQEQYARYKVVKWREVPKVYAMASESFVDTLTPAMRALDRPDCAIVRAYGERREVLTNDGWSSVKLSKEGDWIETWEGFALDSATIQPSWDERQQRLPMLLLGYYPAMRTVTFPIAAGGYAMKVVDRGTAERISMDAVDPGETLPETGFDFTALALKVLSVRPSWDPYLVFWTIEDPDVVLRTIVSLATGRVLYSNTPFAGVLVAPYLRVAGAVFEPPRGIWAVIPRGMYDWVLPGGHIEGDELPRDAVVRELREEVGINTVPVREVGRIYRPWSTTIVYLCRRVGEPQGIATPAEIDAASLIPFDQLSADERLWLRRNLDT